MIMAKINDNYSGFLSYLFTAITFIIFANLFFQRVSI